MSDPIARIEAALKKIGHEYEPPAGWEDRVLAATRTPRVRSFYSQRWWLMFAPVLVVAGVLLWLVVIHASPEPQELGVTWRIETKTSVRGTGSDGAVGDVVHAAVAGGAGYRALRAYRRGVLILDCRATPDGAVSQDVVERGESDAPRCTMDHDQLALSLVLHATGAYKLLGLASPTPLPASQHNFDLDQASAISAKLYRPNLVKSFEVE
jgi:hypothetical protein